VAIGLRSRLNAQTNASSTSGEDHPMRVLVADDGAFESPILHRLTVSQSRDDYTVDRVSAFGDACEAIEGRMHDVYVVTNVVGARTGFDLLSWVKAHGMRLPIVFASGADNHAAGLTAVSAGASCYVVADSIESGLLEHSLRFAVDQTRALDRLDRAGIVVDTDTSMKSRLLFRIAERLREPSSELLETTSRSLEAALPAPALESFRLIEDNAHTLLGLANDLSDLSQLEAGDLQLNREPFSLRGLISDVQKTISRPGDSRSPETTVQIAPDVPDAVIGDPGRLRFVIGSFLETITARNDTDRILLKIRIDGRNSGAIQLRFEIETLGRTVQVDGFTRRSSPGVKSDGNGGGPPIAGALGMPIVLEVVSRMGGAVEVDGNRDMASAVQFTLRLQVNDVGHEARPNLDEHESSYGTVLVIADAASARRSLMSSLGDAGIRFEVARSVEDWSETQGRNADAAVVPDLVLIESSRDCFAVCDEFNHASPTPIPVVIVTASGRRGDAARCRDRGVRGYLSRPMDTADLTDVVMSSMALTSAGDSTTLVTKHWLRDGRPSLHVLVADDSATSRFLLTRMLEQRGHSTATATTGDEAIESTENTSFDVIVMDVMMPVMDGLEATRRIREMYIDSDNRPLIVGVSAFTDAVNLGEAEKAGMDGFLAKPIRPEALFAAVEQQRSAALL
jgi:two-component system sensor histidine kinase/response regulator